MLDKLEEGKIYVFVDKAAKDKFMKRFAPYEEYVECYYKDGFTITMVEANIGLTSDLMTIREDELQYFKLKEETKMSFTKSDLKTGMVIVGRNGESGVVPKGTANGDTYSGETWGMLNSFDENLTDRYSRDFDIMEVWQAHSNIDFLKCTSGDPSKHPTHKLLWKREERKVVKVGDVEYYEDELSDALSKIKPINKGVE